MSNESVVTARRASPGPIAVSFRIESRRLVNAPWVTWTPLGLPVEPEV